MAFRSIVINAMEDWDNLLSELEKDLHNIRYSREDPFRHEVLKELHQMYGVNFHGWIAEEVVVFCFVAYPRTELSRLTRAAETSRFFNLVYELWQPPSLSEWLYMLWRFTKRAYGLFSDLIFVINKADYVDLRTLGPALFRDLVKRGNLHFFTVASLIGALVERPNESTMAKQHADTICKLTANMTVTETGFICRSLILHRTRRSCQCGYKADEDICRCQPSHIELDGDYFKEYATSLLRLVCKRRSTHVERQLTWTEKEEDEFLLAACEYIYSPEVYKEIYQNLNGGDLPSLKQSHERKLTYDEEVMNAKNRRDENYDHSVAQHAGCVTSNCKQAVNLKCSNVSCGQCCKKNGVNNCDTHRHYIRLRKLDEPVRKNVRFEASELNKWLSKYSRPVDFTPRWK